MGQLLCELIKATLTGKDLKVEGVGEEAWERCFETARQQQVLAMTFPAMAALPKEQRPGFLLWSKWMANAQSTAEQSRQKQEAVRKLGAWLSEEGLATTVVKGFSVAVHYPRPELREFSDVDIYSGPDYEAVNNCLTKHGLAVGKADGHHVHIKIDNVSVEHHFAFGNSRVKGDMYGMETALQQLAEKKNLDRIDREPHRCRAYASPMLPSPHSMWAGTHTSTSCTRRLSFATWWTGL